MKVIQKVAGKKLLAVGVSLCLLIVVDAVVANQSAGAVAQADSKKSTRAKSPHVFGICQLVEMDDNGDGNTSLNPVNDANAYFQSQNSDARVTRDSGGFDLEGLNIRVIQSPQHGKMMVFKRGGLTSDIVNTEELSDADYYPNSRYYGNDSLIMQVDGNGRRVELRYYFRMVDKGSDGSIFQNPACKDYFWIISSSYSSSRDSRSLFSLKLRSAHDART